MSNIAPAAISLLYMTAGALGIAAAVTRKNDDASSPRPSQSNNAFSNLRSQSPSYAAAEEGDFLSFMDGRSVQFAGAKRTHNTSWTPYAAQKPANKLHLLA